MAQVGRLVMAFPAEIRNAIYKEALRNPAAFEVVRKYAIIDNDGIPSMDTVQYFVHDVIDGDGNSRLFAKPLMRVRETLEEALSLASASILFVVKSSEALLRFAETFKAYSETSSRPPQLHVEIHLWSQTTDLDALAQWSETMLAHGWEQDIRGVFEDWMDAIQHLPAQTTVYLIFETVWRDYLNMRHLSASTGLSKRPIKFGFLDRKEDIIPNPTFHRIQAMAAIRDVDVEQRFRLDPSLNRELADAGCRGFHPRRS